MTPADIAEIKALFQLDSHAKGLAFLHCIAAFPRRLPPLVPHLMAWCCRARVSAGSIAHIMSNAEPRHMLTKRDLGRLKGIPTLLIWGRHERVFNDRHRAFFLRHLPRRAAVAHTEEEFGHVPFIDDADRVVELLEAFVRERCML
jgi:pimeloyl-ACP methyl ester carboxylesterase